MALVRRALRIGVLAVLAAMVAGAGALAVWVVLPLPDHLLDPPVAPGVRILDRNGVLLRSTRAEDGTRGRWVPLASIDPDLIVAFVAVEDRRFWDHHGVDLRAVARAARDDWRAERIVSGASTISMQLARLLDPGARGWRSKLSETAWALRLEWHLPKQVILEQYLNRVHLGQNTAGVAAAAAYYMGAAAHELSVGEAALLAGLAHAPSRDNPVTSPRRAVARRRVALARMVRAGAVPEEVAARANEEPALTRRARAPFLAPHFTTRVLQELPAITGDITLGTTIDAALQSELEGEARQAVSLLSERGVKQAAIVVLDNATGGVLAWVGSPDFWEPAAGQTDMVTSARQPGSALKPFLYALAFDRGVTAATVLADVPTSFTTVNGTYQPRNYDRRFRGPVRAREALASSYNVPAVILAQRVGTGALLHTLHLAGFGSLARTPEYYGLGLALGNGDVTLMELANGYRALVNGGTYEGWHWRQDDAAAPGDGRRVVSRAAATLVLDVLADPAARVPGFGVMTPFDFPFPAAVKTGTSRHFTDNWAVAVTGTFTVAVWAGDVRGRPMEGVSGVTGAGPLLHRAVVLTAARYAPGLLPSPAEASLTPARICRVSGLLATTECPGMREWFAAGTAPVVRDDWVRAGRVRLPEQYAAWVADAGQGFVIDHDPDWVDPRDRVDAPQAVGPAPTRPRVTSAPRPEPAGFRITSPADGDVYRMPPGVPRDYATVALRAAGEPGEVRWFVDGAPHEAQRWELRPGAHLIRAVAASGRVNEVRIRVEE
ncbi:MAG: penicillin-binding protein 1C [Gemmatimonadetes bacterium]|nr:penicillin-binding protein 1C [Gemmatimonadota bacterium]